MGGVLEGLGAGCAESWDIADLSADLGWQAERRAAREEAAGLEEALRREESPPEAEEPAGDDSRTLARCPQSLVPVAVLGPRHCWRAWAARGVPPAVLAMVKDGLGFRSSYSATGSICRCGGLCRRIGWTRVGFGQHG